MNQVPPNATLRNFRSSRFHGASRSCNLSDLTKRDAQRLEELYRAVSEVSEYLSGAGPQDTNRDVDRKLAESMRQLITMTGGEESNAQPISIRRILHDVLGGGLTSLLWTLDTGLTDLDEIRTTRFLAVDHMKIMRNAIHGLDDYARSHDLEDGLHGVRYLKDRWSGAKLHNALGNVYVRFSSQSNISFAENCFEFSTVQRIIYNLLDNACAHTQDGHIDFEVSEAHIDSHPHVKFVISNHVLPYSIDHFPHYRNGTRLFHDDFSTTGGGLGLGICADLVAEAYGLQSAEQAVAESYVGAELREAQFSTWFHWPAVEAGTIHDH